MSFSSSQQTPLVPSERDHRSQDDDYPLSRLTLSGSSQQKLGDQDQNATHAQSPGRWGIDWKPPAKMVGLFACATAFAIGHHFYYSSLDGMRVSETTSKWNRNALRNGQEWKIRFGTVFAFLVKTLFAAAVVVAFEQYLWFTVRRNAIAVGGLDAMFVAANSLLSFFEREFLRKAKVGAALALLVWLIPISALITPATLTVIPSIFSTSSIMPVPSINFSQVPALFDFSSSVIGNDGSSTDDGITPYMARLVSSTATSLQILPMNVAIPNSTYNMTFHGPSFRCSKPSAPINEAIWRMLNATYFVSASMSGSEYGQADGFRFTSPMAWLAFSPTGLTMFQVGNSTSIPLSDRWYDFLNFAQSCIIQPAMSNGGLPQFESYPLCEGITIPYNRSAKLEDVLALPSTNLDYNLGRTWIWANNMTYDCVLTDTVYSVRFSYSASENAQRVDPVYNFSWTEQDLHGSYFPIAKAISHLLTGAIRGFNSGIMSYKTRVAETAIFGALTTKPAPDSSVFEGLSPETLPPDIKALAQNKSVGELIEELSRNVTLSLFSAEKVLNSNGSETHVTISTHVNVYSYIRQNLIFTYAVTFIASLAGMLIGCFAFIKNGVSHEVSFSTFMSTTRNHRLDGLTMGQSMGALPLNKKTKETELKFGLLPDSSGDAEGEGCMRRVGFGFEDEVSPLEKGAPYK